MASRFHLLVAQADTLFEQTETKVKDTIARELGVSWRVSNGDCWLTSPNSNG